MTIDADTGMRRMWACVYPDTARAQAIVGAGDMVMLRINGREHPIETRNRLDTDRDVITWIWDHRHFNITTHVHHELLLDPQGLLDRFYLYNRYSTMLASV